MLHNAAMARLSSKLQRERENILSPLCAVGAVNVELLQESGLSQLEKRYVRRWVDGGMSGRSCMFALLSSRSDKDAEHGLISGGGDHKRLFALGNSNSVDGEHDKQNGLGLGLSLLSASLNLPPASQMLCNTGYLYETCFSKSPTAVLRQTVNLIRGRALEQNFEVLTTEQLNLALRQLQVHFAFDTDTANNDHSSTFKDSDGKEAFSPENKEIRLKERELHGQVLMELVRLHVRMTCNGEHGVEEKTKEDNATDSDQNTDMGTLQAELLEHLLTPLSDLKEEALATPAAELEVKNRLLKPYLQRLTSLKSRLSIQLQDMEQNEAYYTLGVTEQSTPAEVKKAYHRLSRKVHPDRKNGNKVEFQRLQAAYQEVMKRCKVQEGESPKASPKNSPKGSPQRPSAKASEVSQSRKKYNLGGEDVDSDEMETILRDGASKDEELKQQKSVERTTAAARPADPSCPKSPETSGSDGDEAINLLSDSSDDEATRKEKADRLKVLQQRARCRAEKSRTTAANPTPDSSGPAKQPPSDPRNEDEPRKGSALPGKPFLGTPGADHGPETEKIARDVLADLSSAMLKVKQSTEECTHLAQLALYWQGLLDRTAGVEVIHDSGLDGKAVPLKIRQTRPPKDSLSDLIDLIFDGCGAEGRTDAGVVATVDADACLPRKAIAPLEALCASLQLVAATAMRLPLAGSLYGMATAKDDMFIASVEKCMQSGLDALKTGAGLERADAQLQTCLARLQASAEFRDLRYGMPTKEGPSHEQRKKKRLQKRLRQRLEAKFARQQLRMAEKQRRVFALREARQSQRNLEREVRLKEKRAEKRVLMLATRRVEKRRIRREQKRWAKRTARFQVRKEQEQLKQQEEARAAAAAAASRAAERAARAMSERHARVSQLNAGMAELPAIDILERVSEQARSRARSAEARALDTALPIPPPVPPREASKSQVRPPPAHQSRPVSSTFLEGFNERAIYTGMADQTSSNRNEYGATIGHNSETDESSAVEPVDSDSEDSADSITKRYNIYRAAYDECVRNGSASADAVAAAFSLAASAKSHGLQSDDDDSDNESSLPLPSKAAPMGMYATAKAWSFQPYDLDEEEDALSLDSYGLPKRDADSDGELPDSALAEGRQKDKSDEDYDRSTFASDVAEIDDLLRRMEQQSSLVDAGISDRSNQNTSRVVYSDPLNPRIHYGDMDDMDTDFMTSTRNFYQTRNKNYGVNASLYASGDVAEGFDSECSGSDVSTTSSEFENESDSDSTLYSEDISVSDTSSSSDLSQEESKSDASDDMDDEDVFLDEQQRSIFDNLSESDGDTSDDSDDSAIDADGEIVTGAEHGRSGAAIFVDMITTAYRSASTSLNIAAEQVAGAACAAGIVYRQAQSIVRKAEGELSAGVQTAARNKAAADEQDYSAEDLNELNELRKKQSEAEEQAQNQAAAEQAAADTLRKVQEENEDEAAVEAELEAAGVQGVRREMLRKSKLDCRRTDRELGSLKGKIQSLQVQLRLQHVKNLQSANLETRHLQNRLQAQFLACVHSETNTFDVEVPVVMRSTNLPDVQTELENLQRTLNTKSATSSTNSPKASVDSKLMSSPTHALLTLLADFIDSSLSDLRQDESCFLSSAPSTLACVMKHLGWLMTLMPIAPLRKSRKEETNDTKVLNIPVTPLAILPDGRSKALWLAALLVPNAFGAMCTELQSKLIFLDVTCSELSSEAAPHFGQNAGHQIPFSELFCTRIHNGILAARNALK